MNGRTILQMLLFLTSEKQWVYDIDLLLNKSEKIMLVKTTMIKEVVDWRIEELKNWF